MKEFFSCQKLESFKKLIALVHIWLIFVDVSKLSDRGEIIWASNESLYTELLAAKFYFIWAKNKGLSYNQNVLLLLGNLKYTIS